MRLGIVKELAPGETRVAMVPDAARLLIKKGHQLIVERGAGKAASIPDSEYEAAGAELAPDAQAVFKSADCIVKVQPPTDSELAQFRSGQSYVGFLWHQRNRKIVESFAKTKVTSFSMDAIPRITRAQSMDALSSMATISGYKAVLLAASHLPKFLPMLTTAAGTIKPAHGLIIGAGVAGLQAIATARRLGAVVEAFDARPAVKEQVLSLGATFAEDPSLQGEQDKYGYAKEASAEMLARQQAFLQTRIQAADFVITTAQVPGKPAPRLITANTVAAMRPGSAIVDLAAETGGNCEATRQGEIVVTDNGVHVIGTLNLPATMPLDASRMYARNIFALVSDIATDKGFTFDWNNEVFRETCITHDGEVKKQ